MFYNVFELLSLARSLSLTTEIYFNFKSFFGGIYVLLLNAPISLKECTHFIKGA